MPLSPQQNRFAETGIGGTMGYGNPTPTFDSNRFRASDSAGSQYSGTQKSAFDAWFAGWQQREKERALAQRPQSIAERERQMGLSGVEQYIGEQPSGLMMPLKAAATLGVTSFGQLASGVGSYLPGSLGQYYSKRKEVYDDRAKILSGYINKANNDHYAPPALPAWAGNTLSGLIASPQELYNPSKKYMAANAAWHALRGYVEGKGLSGSAIAGGSNAAGEGMETALSKKVPLLGRFIPGGIPGNVFGYGLETGINSFAK